MLLKNTNIIPDSLRSMNVIFANESNNIITNAKLADMNTLNSKNNHILYLKSEEINILDAEYSKLIQYINSTMNDLILLIKYITISLKRKGKSLIIAENNDIFYNTLYKCFQEEYKNKIDIIII